MIAAGKFKYLITILSLSKSRDAMGGEKETLVVKHANLPAFVEEFSGREKFYVQGDREVSYDQKRIEIRYLTGVTKIDKVLYNGETFDILRVEQVGFREATRLTVQLAE